MVADRQARDRLPGCRFPIVERPVVDKEGVAESQMYDEAMSGIKKHLIARTKSGIMYTHELLPQQDQQSKQL